MHTVSAFYGAQSGTVTLGTLNAVADQIVTVTNNAIVLPNDRKLLAAYVGGTGLTQAVFNSPRMSSNGKPAIYPIDAGALGGNLPATYRPMPNGLTLPAREQINIQISHTGAGPDDVAALVFHTPAFKVAPPGPYRTAILTATGAGAGFVWNLLSLSLAQGLASGRYTCVGLAIEGTNVLAARLVFPGQFERPGCLGEVSAASFEFDYWRYGNMGVFGLFDNDNLPQIEVFGVGTLSGTITVYMDVINTPMLAI